MKETPTNPIARFFKTDPYRELFRGLADSIETSLLVVSLQDEAILDTNPAFLLLSGYARKELDELSPRALFAESFFQQHLLAPHEESFGKRSIQDAPLRTRAGEIEFVDLEVHHLPSLQENLLVFLRPSSSRQQQHLRLHAELELLEGLAGLSSMLLGEADVNMPDALDLGSRLLQASHLAIYRVSSQAPDYMLTGELPADFPERLPAAELGPMQPSKDWSLGQRPDHVLHRAARAAGLERLILSPLGESGAWIGLLVAGWKKADRVPGDAQALLDLIGQQVHASLLLSQLRSSFLESQQERRELEGRLADYYEAISDTLISVDEELNITYANEALYRLLGYHPEEILERPVQDILVGPEDITATLLDALGHQRTAERARIAIHHRDGTPFPVYLRAVPLPESRQTGLLILLRDQSEQQAIEDQTETLAQRALLGEVAAIFAHEVRNPINNISTGVQLVASRLGRNHPLFQALETVHAECDRLNQLMSDVLFFSRPLELKMESLDLAAFLERILTRWAPRFHQANVRCHTSFSPDAPPASADPRTLERVIVNLVSNALEAMSSGGTLSISLAPKEGAYKEMLELKVADTGPGIPPDKIDRIFDPFFTTKKDGTGLGLAISRRILAAHKGSMQVESFPDAGTVFTLFLPTATAKRRSDA